MIALGAAAALICIRALTFRGTAEYRQSMEEQQALGMFAMVEQQMIAENAPGVVGPDDHKFISSFKSFFSYVAKRYPQRVSSLNAPNPFPGFLPGQSYDRLSGVAHDGMQPMIVSRTFHMGNGENYKKFITCDGHLGIEKGDDP